MGKINVVAYGNPLSEGLDLNGLLSEVYYIRNNMTDILNPTQSFMESYIVEPKERDWQLLMCLSASLTTLYFRRKTGEKYSEWEELGALGEDDDDDI